MHGLGVLPLRLEPLNKIIRYQPRVVPQQIHRTKPLVYRLMCACHPWDRIQYVEPLPALATVPTTPARPVTPGICIAFVALGTYSLACPANLLEPLQTKL